MEVIKTDQSWSSRAHGMEVIKAGQSWSSRALVWRSLRQVSHGAVGPWCEAH